MHAKTEENIQPRVLHCQNCNQYKHESELKEYGAIVACKTCRAKLNASVMKKAQISFFDDQQSLFG